MATTHTPEADPASDIDEDARGRLGAWLSRHIAPCPGLPSLKKFSGGQSNPTYLVTAGAARMVLRRKPFGVLLPKAHMIEREYKAICAFAATDVPVPKPLGLCDDPSVIGAAFYLMEFVDGRIFWDPSLPGLSKTERSAIYSSMCDTVARLHAVRPNEVGLADFGRAEGFMARQIALWSSQYRASQTHEIPAMDRLIEWLPANLEEGSSDVAVFHGDLRLDNMIFHPTEPKVLAILDWELSTLGDPMADFAYHAMIWRIPPDLFRGLAGVDLAGLGIPSEEKYFDSYLSKSNKMRVPNWNFYLAFSMFRIAAILQGVAMRAHNGNASADNAEDLGARAAPLAALGWGIAQESP